MSDSPTPPTLPVKVPWHAHLVSGWPLVLVAVGGLLGGLCGGAAYAIAITVIRKKGVSVATYIAAVVIGILGIALYFGAIFALVSTFPDMFRK